MTPIAIQLYSVRQQAQQDPIGVLRKMAEFGYAGVELAGFYGRQPEDIKQVLDDLGLRVSSAHWALATEQNLQELLDHTGLMGVNTVVSGWKDRQAWDSLKGIEELADAFQQAAELLRPHGLSQAYHNHWWELQPVDGRPALEVYYERAPAAASELDVYWACRFGEVDVPAFLRKWAARCPLLHVKDGPLVQGQPHTAVGAGKMDTPAVVGAADKAILQWLIVELDECATDMMTAVKQSLDYLTSHNLGVGRQ